MTRAAGTDNSVCMRLRFVLPVLSVLILAACAPVTPSPPMEAAAPQRVRVTVTRDAGAFTADYVLDRDAPVWAFHRSKLARVGRKPWRPEQWTVLTPGVVMQRRGFYDILTTTDGGPVPRRLTLALRPDSTDLEADYDPALLFSDGAVALYTDHFDLIPLESVQAAEALPMDLNGVVIPGSGGAEVTWRDTAGPVLFRGERRASVTARDADTYVLFGDAQARTAGGVAAIVDPGLPRWVGDELAAFTPRILGYYASRLGHSATATPTVMVSWRGPTGGLSSMGGSVMDGLIVMTFEGEGVERPSAAALHRARWFIGHEAAHFWLGQTVRYEFARDAWITEGGADLMAVRAMKALDPAYDDRAELQGEVDDCVRLAAHGPIGSAGERGEHRAYYACGAVFALAAEGAVRRRGGRDVFDFLSPLIAANRADGVLTRPEWLAELSRVSGDDSQARAIARLLDEGAADPAVEVEGLLSRAGVAVRRTGGRVTLIG